MTKRLFSLAAIALLAGTSAGWAGSMSGGTHGIIPTSVNSGGHGDATSTSHGVIGGAGESGGAEMTSTGHFLQTGFGNLLAWPETVRDLGATPGSSEGIIVLSWTSPLADGGQGTSAEYSVRMSSGAELPPAESEEQFWLSLSATHYVTVSVPGTAGTNEQLTVTGLANGVTYYFAVKAKSSADAWGYLSNSATAWAQIDSLAPNAVALSAAAGANEGELDLSWTVTGDNGNLGGIAGGQYEITYSSHGDFSSAVNVVAYSTTIAAGAAVSRTLTGLEGGKVYYAKVRLADESANWSGQSNTESAAARFEAVPPGTVSLSAAAGAAEGELNLSWTVTGDDGSAGNIVGGQYEIQYSVHSDFSSEVFTITNATSVSAGAAVGYTLSGLTGGITYYARVRLADEVPNWSAASSAASAAAQGDVTPPNPVSVAASGVGVGAIDLSWNVTGDDGNSGNITGGQYEITYSSYSNFTNTVYTVTNATTVAAGAGVEYSLTGLETGKTYYAKVRLADEAGNWSGSSNVADAAAQGDVTPPSPVTVSASAGAADGTIDLSWTVTGDNGSVKDIVGGQYEITYSSYSGFTNTVHTITNSTSVSAGAAVGYTLTGLGGGKTYYIKVRLADEIPNWSGISNTASAVSQSDITPPAAVSLSAAPGEAEGQVKLSWTVTGDDGSSGNITAGQYEITYSSYSGFTNTVHTIANSTTVAAGAAVGYTLTGLEAGKTYYAKVRLADGVPNWSGQSNTANAAAQGDVTAPAPVSLSAVTGAAEGQVDLAWNVTGDDGSSGSIVAGQYEITYSSYSSFTNTVYTVTNATSVAAGAAVGYTLTGLESGKFYYARARLADEAGNWSGNSNSASAASQADVTSPAAVTLSASMGDSPGRLNLDWTATGDDGNAGNITSGQYEITYSSYSDFTNTVYTLTNPMTVAAGAAMSYTLTGLDDGIAYYAKVRLADEASNWSGYSNVASASTMDGAAPGAVGDLDANPGSNEGEILLTWSATGDNGSSGSIVGGKYRIDYSDDPDYVFSAGSFKIEASFDAAPGAPQTLVVAHLLPEVTYYLKVFLADDVLNWSPASNLAASSPRPAGASQTCSGCALFAGTPAQGGRNSISANHFLTNTVGEIGSSSFTSVSHILQPGFGNLMVWAETIIDLSASTGTLEGEIVLQWTAPKADGSTGTAAAYEIRYASVTANSPALSETRFWLTASVTDFIAVPAPSSAGATEHLTLTGLERGATYYFAIRARSSWEGWGYLSPGATTWAQVDAVAPGPIMNLDAAYGPAGGSIDLTWNATGDNGGAGNIVGGKYRIDYSSDPEHVFSTATFRVEFATNTTPGQAEAYRLPGLLGGATFFVRVYLGDEVVMLSPLSNGATAQARVYVPDIAAEAFAGIRASSFTLTWSSGTEPGYNRQGTLYRAEASTSADFTAIAVSSETAELFASLDALDPNTTYYTRVRAFSGINISTYAEMGDIATLASPPQPGALQFLSIVGSSVTVAWAALPGESSMTCEGYTLLASSDDFGALAPFGATTFSSTTYSARASTLTVGSDAAPLDLSSTYYFKVASLNWAGRPNYTTLSRLNFQLQQSTDSLHLGQLGLVNGVIVMSTVSTSSMVVTNVGNWPMTIALAASTATLPSSPWALSTSSGNDVAALLGVWHTGEFGPPVGDFTTYITTTPTVSQAAGNYYSETQDGFQLAPGESATLWFRFFLPTSTSSLEETIKVTPQPVYP